MTPFSHFTTKAKEAVRKAHELAIERGQNHVAPVHLLAALLLQEESIVLSILERLNIDTILLTDILLENIETYNSERVTTPSYQIYLAPELAHMIEHSAKVASSMNDQYVSTEHLFIAALDVQNSAGDILKSFKIDREQVLRVLQEIRQSKEGATVKEPKKNRTILKFTRSLTELAKQNKLDPVVGRDEEISRIVQILSRRTKN